MSSLKCQRCPSEVKLDIEKQSYICPNCRHVYPIQKTTFVEANLTLYAKIQGAINKKAPVCEAFYVKEYDPEDPNNPPYGSEGPSH